MAHLNSGTFFFLQGEEQIVVFSQSDLKIAAVILCGSSSVNERGLS